MAPPHPHSPAPRCRSLVDAAVRGAADETFTPYLEQIDQVDQNLAALEQATKEIDEYSKRLEAKFKKVLAK